MFSSIDTEATIVMAFTLGTSLVFTAFFGYAFYNRELIYTSWEARNGAGYVVLGDGKEQATQSEHMKSHNRGHKNKGSKEQPGLRIEN